MTSVPTLTHPRSAGRPRRRPALVGTALASLLAAGVSVLPVAPAAADTAAPTFAWEISPRFDDHLSTHTLDGGATESADGVITFVGGVGEYDPADGSTTMSYTGSVKGAFVIALTEYYQVTFADPQVTIDDSGAGEISALVSASNAAAQGNPAASVDPARVVVTRFTSPGWTAGDPASLTATPQWAGVIPAGSETATSLGMAEGRPVDGQSFAPEFLTHLPSGVRAHFYASGASSDAAKAPSAFTAQSRAAQAAADPAVSLTTLSTSYADGVRVRVDGTGFNGRTLPGDDGVYVGVAPAGGMPDTSSMAGQDAFATASWVSAAQIEDGALSTTLTIPRDKLTRGTAYAVYTWQAHAHSNTTQDTETALSLDWAALRAPSTVSTTLVRRATAAKPGRVKVVVTAPRGEAVPTGSVVVTLVRGSASATSAVVRLSSGRALVTLPRLAQGRWRATATYRGSGLVAPGTDRVTVRVTRR